MVSTNAVMAAAIVAFVAFVAGSWIWAVTATAGNYLGGAFGGLAIFDAVLMILTIAVVATILVHRILSAY